MSTLSRSNNQVAVFTGSGQQLVVGCAGFAIAVSITLARCRATSQWSANPNQDEVGTITLTSPGGSTTDLVAGNAIQSGEIGAYLQMRDTILPQAQAQLDEMANQMSQALSNQTTNGTPAGSGSQTGFSVSVGGICPGNSIQLAYTDSGNVQHAITIVALGQGGVLPTQPPDSINQTIGINFSGGINTVVCPA